MLILWIVATAIYGVVGFVVGTFMGVAAVRHIHKDVYGDANKEFDKSDDDFVQIWACLGIGIWPAQVIVLIVVGIIILLTRLPWPGRALSTFFQKILKRTP